MLRQGGVPFEDIRKAYAQFDPSGMNVEWLKRRMDRANVDVGDSKKLLRVAHVVMSIIDLWLSEARGGDGIGGEQTLRFIALLEQDVRRQIVSLRSLRGLEAEQQPAVQKLNEMARRLAELRTRHTAAAAVVARDRHFF